MAEGPSLALGRRRGSFRAGSRPVHEAHPPHFPVWILPEDTRCVYCNDPFAPVATVMAGIWTLLTLLRVSRLLGS